MPVEEIEEAAEVMGQCVMNVVYLATSPKGVQTLVAEEEETEEDRHQEVAAHPEVMEDPHQEGTELEEVLQGTVEVLPAVTVGALPAAITGAPHEADLPHGIEVLLASAEVPQGHTEALAVAPL